MARLHLLITNLCTARAALRTLLVANDSTPYPQSDREEVVTEVRAQVMARDDSSGGWVPVAGGGLSCVTLMCRHMKQISPHHMDDGQATSVGVPVASEFVIQGRRLTDNVVIMDCALDVDVQYVMVNPTFHHWQTGNRRYGLTFQSSSDAHVFEHNIRAVLYETLREHRKYIQTCVRQSHHGASQSGDEILMMFKFNSQKLEAEGVLPFPSCTHAVHQCCQHYSVTNRTIDVIEEDLENDFNNEIQFFKDSTKQHINETALNVDSSYVRFSKADGVTSVDAHDYCYPSLKSVRTVTDASCQTDEHNHVVTPVTLSAGSKMLPQAKEGIEMPLMKSSRLTHLNMHRRWCIYCGEWMDINCSPKHCPDAPDKTLDCIKMLTCVNIADAVGYHCLADEEGSFKPLCNLWPPTTSVAWWTLLLILTLFLPCLCCFWPLIGCRRCVIGCGCCINPHKAV